MRRSLASQIWGQDLSNGYARNLANDGDLADGKAMNVDDLRELDGMAAISPFQYPAALGCSN